MLAFTSPVDLACLPLRSARIRTNNHTLVHRQVLPDPSHHVGLRIQVVDRDIEKSLNLGRMKVHCDDVVAAGRLEHVRDQLGADRCPRTILFILTSFLILAYIL